MIDPKCKTCLGLGWVCENHPNRVWEKERGCQCGAGMPCKCNETPEVRQGIEEPVILEIIVDPKTVN